MLADASASVRGLAAQGRNCSGCQALCGLRPQSMVAMGEHLLKFSPLHPQIIILMVNLSPKQAPHPDLIIVS